MDMELFLAAVERLGRPAILDGGMGTELARRGMAAGAVACVRHAEAVLEVHRAYLEAGCDAIITNTFSTNRIYAETHGVDLDPAEVNRAGVDLARRAAGDARLVLGDVGPTGQMLEPYGTYTEEQFEATYREQAQWLADAGVDALIIETMSAVGETRCALRACRETGLPVIASISVMTAADGGRTMMGDRAGDCAEALAADGAAAFGLNCGDLGPDDLAQVVAEVKGRAPGPIAVQPNAGRPRLVDGESVFDLAPEAFVRGVRRCADAGATILGGCCGTTPAHIDALRGAFK